MRRGKVRTITLLATAAMLAVLLLPSAVLAHEFCRFYGPVTVHGQNMPPGTVVSAWLEDPYIGPWTSTMYDHHGVTWYRLDVPRDNPATPGKEGGVEGETVYFRVTYDCANVSAPSAKWESVGFIYHPIRLTVIPGDCNGDGVVNMADVTCVELIILGLKDPTPGADANLDGVINMADVTKIERIILGIDC